MFMMQNMSVKGVSLIFRASEGRGPQKFSLGQAPGPPYFLAALALCPSKGRDLATPLRLSNEGNEGTDKKGCSRCGKSRCQVCNVMSNCDHFHSNVNSREYRINYSFNCDSSNVLYLLTGQHFVFNRPLSLF